MCIAMACTYHTRGGVAGHPMTGLAQHMLRLPGPSGFHAGSTAHEVASQWDGSGKSAVVTGAASGLGKETAAALASRGCHVVLAVRPGDGGEEAAADIMHMHPGAQVSVKYLDLASLDSVRAFAAAYKASGQPLHLLICNAGVMACPYMQSADGHEMQFATNHLGHFLLVDLLKPVLAWSAEAVGAHSRIVVVSSAAHHATYSTKQGGPLLLHDISSVDAYHRYCAYGHSKLCNLLFVRELHRRLQQEDAPITAVAAHPGVTATPLKNSLGVNPCVLGGLIWASGWMLKSIPQGAATQTWAATSKALQGGEYYADCNLCPSSAPSHDAELGRRLWKLSEQIVATTDFSEE